MIVEMPYFLTNKSWYSYNVNSGKYELTKGAPFTAIDSYNQFYKILNSVNNYSTEEN